MQKSNSGDEECSICMSSTMKLVKELPLQKGKFAL